MTNYSVFTFYGKDEVARDIIKYCVNNPNGLDFGNKLDISYRKLEFGMGYISVLVDYNDYATLDEFKIVAELLREV